MIAVHFIYLAPMVPFSDSQLQGAVLKRSLPTLLYHYPNPRASTPGSNGSSISLNLEHYIRVGPRLREFCFCLACLQNLCNLGPSLFVTPVYHLISDTTLGHPTSNINAEMILQCGRRRTVCCKSPRELHRDFRNSSGEGILDREEPQLLSGALAPARNRQGL